MKKQIIIWLLCLIPLLAASSVIDVEIELPGMTIVGDVEEIKPTHNITKVTVEVMWHETQEDLNAMYKRQCLSQIQDCETSVLGYAYYSLEDKLCWIHTLKPKHRRGDRMEVLGHEFAHCLFGDYHD